LVLAERLADESSAAACEVRPELHAKLLQTSRSGPAGASPAVPEKRRVHRLRSRIIPAAAAAAILFAFVAAYLYKYKRPEVPPPNGNGADPVIVRLVNPADLATDCTSAIAVTVQGPIEEEIRLLKEDGMAAADFILACLPIDIDSPFVDESP